MVVGFLVVLFSSVFFCFQNVIVRILFNTHTLLGIWETGGFVNPTLENSFLLLFMRMAWVVPLIGAALSVLYAPSWQELRQLRESRNRPLLGRAIAGGGLMFLYLALLYVSVGLVPTGIAMTLFFTYPVFTAGFSWWWFGVRPTRFRWGVMVLVMLGSVLTLPHTSAASSGSWLGAVMGVGAGVTYALYTVNAQKSFESIHPVPFTWVSFAVTLGLSGVSLLLWHGQLGGLMWTALWIGGFLSAIATSIGHLLNNYGIRLIGATAAAMIGATNPALTVVLAWLTIQETLTPIQLSGVILVTLSVALLSQEKPKK